MFGFRKSPNTTVVKQNSVEPGTLASSKANPFDSDSDSNTKNTLTPARRTSSEPVLPCVNAALSDDEGRGGISSGYAAINKYKNDFRDSGGMENQSVQELEKYAAYKSEETTKSVDSFLKIAEDIRDEASKTLVTLHHQGEQITRTHNTVANIDQDLSRGEKLLGGLGGMFSKTWKPKKSKAITGPVITRDDSFKKRGNRMEQREKLGIAPAPRGRSNPRQPSSEPTTALQKVEVEKAKQDDGLDDLSNILGDLKVMAVDMGSEIERQNKALDHLHDDVEELNSRVKGANQRGVVYLESRKPSDFSGFQIQSLDAGSSTTVTTDFPSEWAEAFVNEMKNASDTDDARARALRALDTCEKSILNSEQAAPANCLLEENAVLEKQNETLNQDIGILKRALVIQREQHNEACNVRRSLLASTKNS